MVDLNVEMPKYTEHIRIVNKDEEVERRFNVWHDAIKDYAYDARNSCHSSQWHQTVKQDNYLLFFGGALTYRLNNPCCAYEHTVRTEVRVFNKPEVEIIEKTILFEPIEKEYRTTKEKELLDIVTSEFLEGRRILLYTVYHEANQITDRLKDVLADLSEKNIKVEAMPESLKSENIEEWIANECSADVLICSQKRVATGLDLVMFHTVIFYELDRQLRIVQQSKTRPWRPIGQTKDVRVYFLAYRGRQELELINIAKKMRAAATIEGVLIDENTIAQIYDYNREMTQTVAEITEVISRTDLGETDFVRGREMTVFEQQYKAACEANKIAAQQTAEEEEFYEAALEVKTFVEADVHKVCEESVAFSKTNIGIKKGVQATFDFIW
jgi:hypothetical protein